MPHRQQVHTLRSPVRRRAVRAVQALAATALVAVTLGSGAAFASPPKQWPTTPSISLLHVLTVFVFIPGALFLAIAALVLLPSRARSRGASYQPGLAWRGEPTWFGGPREGLDAVETSTGAGTPSPGDPDATRGGAGGRW